MFIIPEGFQYAWFNDIPKPEMDKWGASLAPSALGAVTTLVPQEGFDPKHWRISYLLTTRHDLAMPALFQRFLLEKAREAGVLIDDIFEMDSGHFVQISHAQEVAQWISLPWP